MEYIQSMKFAVTVKKVVLKRFDRLPENVQERFYALVRLLEADGPTGGYIFHNYSKLNETEYHCHLTRCRLLAAREENHNN
jgi:hypothetical protein